MSTPFFSHLTFTESIQILSELKEIRLVGSFSMTLVQSFYNTRNF
jgi:hypothetical protein